MKHSFNLWFENTTVRVEVGTIDLLQENQTFRISSDGEFLGYIERLSPYKYVTISKNTIPLKILESSIEVIEEILIP